MSGIPRFRDEGVLLVRRCGLTAVLPVIIDVDWRDLALITFNQINNHLSNYLSSYSGNSRPAHFSVEDVEIQFLKFVSVLASLTNVTFLFTAKTERTEYLAGVLFGTKSGR